VFTFTLPTVMKPADKTKAMKRKDIITIIEAAGPFTNPMFNSDSPTFGKCNYFEPDRKFILAALRREVKPAFEYKNPDHTGYLFKGCHLGIERVCQELGIGDYVSAGYGIYETIVSFKNLTDKN
jgi:hypothetical protein